MIYYYNSVIGVLPSGKHTGVLDNWLPAWERQPRSVRLPTTDETIIVQFGCLGDMQIPRAVETMARLKALGINAIPAVAGFDSRLGNSYASWFDKSAWDGMIAQLQRFVAAVPSAVLALDLEPDAKLGGYPLQVGDLPRVAYACASFVYALASRVETWLLGGPHLLPQLVVGFAPGQRYLSEETYDLAASDKLPAVLDRQRAVASMLDVDDWPGFRGAPTAALRKRLANLGVTNWWHYCVGLQARQVFGTAIAPKEASHG